MTTLKASKHSAAQPPTVSANDGHGEHSHVQFYDDDEVLIDAVAEFLGAGLRMGDPVLAIVTETHRVAIGDRLRAKGLDVDNACAVGQLTFLDARATLTSFMAGPIEKPSGLTPDAERFHSTVGAALQKIAARSPGRRPRAYADMIDVLWKADNRKAAIQLEELWSDLQSGASCSPLCAYAIGSFYKSPADLDHVFATEDAPRLAREIAERVEVERALREALRDARRKEDELRHGKEDLKDFIENAALGLHRVGPDGKILWANAAELKLLGYGPQEYIGRHIADFHVDKDVIDDMLSRLTRNEELHNYEARLRAKDGSIRHVLISSNAYCRDGRFVHTRCFTRDITERRRAEEALRENEQQLRALTDALPALVSYVDAQQRYRFVNATYERWFGLPKDEFVDKHMREVLGDDAFEQLKPHVDAVLSGQTVRFESRVSYRKGGERFIEATYIPQSASDGTIRGFIALVSDVSDRKHLEEARAAATAQTERLLKITSALAEAVTAEQVFEAVVDSAAAAVEASTAGLWLLESDGRARLVRALGFPESAKERFDRVPLDAEPSLPVLDCIRRGEPIWVSSQQELLRQYPDLASAVSPEQSFRLACLPLIVRGLPIGALCLTADEERETTDDERSFLLLVARYASQATERVHLLESERRSRLAADSAATRTGVLSRASRTFAEAAPDLNTVLQALVEEVARDYSQGALVTLIADDGETLELAAVRHQDAQKEAAIRAMAERTPAKVGEGVSGRVAQTGEPVFLPVVDPQALLAAVAPQHRAVAQHVLPRSLLAVPLRSRGRILGTLTTIRYEGSPTFSEEDKTLIEELAERAATAIENSRLHQENLQARSRAEHLYRFAQAVVVAERVEQVFEAALDVIDRAVGTTRAAILTFDEDGVLRFKAWRGLSDEYRRAAEGTSPWARDVASPRPIMVHDTETDLGMAAHLPLLRKERIGALGFIPLVAAGRLLGKLMLYYEQPHRFSALELELAEAIANHLASVVDRFAATAKLQETVRFHEVFAGILAHDLRNPLGAILAAAQTVLRRQEGEGDRVRKPLNRILSSGERMTRMIEQLLDFTRVRLAGGIETQPRLTNLADICAQAIAELELAYPEWDIKMQSVGDLSGVWDSDRLLQVVSNLVANAGQHGTADAGILVELEGKKPDSVSLAVKNRGHIPEPLLRTLFDPFRAIQHRREQSRGLGLGLFIVKQVVVAHGGTVDVSSSEQAGTTFVVRLPRQAVSRT